MATKHGVVGFDDHQIGKPRYRSARRLSANTRVSRVPSRSTSPRQALPASSLSRTFQREPAPTSDQPADRGIHGSREQVPRCLGQPLHDRVIDGIRRDRRQMQQYRREQDIVVPGFGESSAAGSQDVRSAALPRAAIQTEARSTKIPCSTGNRPLPDDQRSGAIRFSTKASRVDNRGCPRPGQGHAKCYP